MQDVDELGDFVRVKSYNPERKVLSVVLKSGECMVFQGVPQGRFELLECSEDKSRYFNKYIRARHEQVAVNPPVPEPETKPSNEGESANLIKSFLG